MRTKVRHPGKSRILSKRSDETKDSNGKVLKSQISLESADKINENDTSADRSNIEAKSEAIQRQMVISKTRIVKIQVQGKPFLKEDDKKNTEVKDDVPKSQTLEKKFGSVDKSSLLDYDQDESKMENMIKVM